ncbi:aryldialkylphosphatase [Nonomuraea lactucae]|uniref:phosphotriesterase family protein n=1 Tax=Nonomuraea lactucae TaxID=2249762 RepID=UPI001F06E059|nr:aryldialkylphosphatase [Nonomuraea lactucae]
MLRTVTGPVRAASIDGAVLPHEHLRTDTRWGAGIASDPYRWLDEEHTVTAELHGLRQSDQVELVVDLTCVGMGRDADALARIAAAGRVPVIAGTGLFTEPFAQSRDADVDTLTKMLMREITDGLDGTGVFPGVIGEIGCWGATPTPAEERALVAAARASIASRLPVATYGRDCLGMLEILLGQGLHGSRLSIGYAGADVPTARKIAEAGAYVSLTAFGAGAQQAARVAFGLIEEGHADRLLLSTGLSRIEQVRKYGGRGYGLLFRSVLPLLREAGVSDDTIRLITHDNPLRWLTSGTSVPSLPLALPASSSLRPGRP